LISYKEDLLDDMDKEKGKATCGSDINTQ